MLGIPSVRDRIVQQALLDNSPTDLRDKPPSIKLRLQARAELSPGNAIMFMRKHERSWVVDMDLTKCFDTLNHDQVLATFRKRVVDGNI